MDYMILKELVASGNVREGTTHWCRLSSPQPNLKGDAGSLMLAMEENAQDSPNMSFHVKLAIQEEDKVVVYPHVKQHPDELRWCASRKTALWNCGMLAKYLPKEFPQ